jgi:hypothetical protein
MIDQARDLEHSLDGASHTLDQQAAATLAELVAGDDDRSKAR